MNLIWHLKFCGVLLTALALLHPAFARRLQWREELAGVSLCTRQVFWVHTFFICVVLVQFGVLSFGFASLLIERTLLAKVVLAGMALFWAIRLFAQHFVYSPALWRGNPFNTTMHVLFSGLWLYLTLVYGIALHHQFSGVP